MICFGLEGSHHQFPIPDEIHALLYFKFEIWYISINSYTVNKWYTVYYIFAISLSTSLLCCSCPRQTSDWAARPLAKEQLQYAALDAFCLLGLARKLPPEILDAQNLKVGPGLQTDQRWSEGRMGCALAFRPFILQMAVVVLVLQLFVCCRPQSAMVYRGSAAKTYCSSLRGSYVSSGVMICCQVFFAKAIQFPLPNGWTWVRLRKEINWKIGGRSLYYCFVCTHEIISYCRGSLKKWKKACVDHFLQIHSHVQRLKPSPKAPAWASNYCMSSV